MGRQQSIDRDSVLDAAEKVIARDGAGGLTLEAVAREAGVSKGGLQYCYRSKDSLIEAMVHRVMTAHEGRVRRYVAMNEDDPLANIVGYIEAARAEDMSTNSRSASLLASLVRAPEFQQAIRQGYRQMFQTVDLKTQAGRVARVALIAAEGICLLRGLGLYEMEDDEWEDVFSTIRSLVAQ